MMEQHELRRMRVTKIALHPKSYPRNQVNMAVAVKYADAMKKGAVFPSLITAECYGETVLVDGAHRLKAYELCNNGSGPAEVEVESLGELTEIQILEESVKRNRAHGLPFAREDIAKIAKEMTDRGKNLTYVSGLLQIPESKLSYEKGKKLITPHGKVVHVLENSPPRQRNEGEGLPLSMTARELIETLTGHVKRGSIGKDDETLNLLKKLRDEIDGLLRSIMKESKNAKKGEREKRGKAAAVAVPSGNGITELQLETINGYVEGSADLRIVVEEMLRGYGRKSVEELDPMEAFKLIEKLQGDGKEVSA